ncbi:unnamed protein product [Allacma fusca]|uniref:Uncharacterized protein n=1 Tax=Allacma fusca TaxID=39272 RepID=A0A8J2JDH2_9HEXA|nr:unnamed protein product [Allacma fusca]
MRGEPYVLFTMSLLGIGTFPSFLTLRNRPGFWDNNSPSECSLKNSPLLRLFFRMDSQDVQECLQHTAS